MKRCVSFKKTPAQLLWAPDPPSGTKAFWGNQMLEDGKLQTVILTPNS